MKKIVAIIAIVLVAIVAIPYLILVSRYEHSETFDNFPIPKGAESFGEEKNSDGENTLNIMGFKWSNHSKDIPKDYKLLIKLNGWKEEEVEEEYDGSLRYSYTKGDSLVDLTSIEEHYVITLSIGELNRYKNQVGN
ncbi:hypothetical protein ACFVT8_23755 [Lysinibacillus sp. NPDC058147]|uniref:hypothetical protein n=1 Tax=unclassified Lysinibacillus TaxID=2636778 RepID=UPI0036DE4B32